MIINPYIFGGLLEKCYLIHTSPIQIIIPPSTSSL